MKAIPIRSHCSCFVDDHFINGAIVIKLSVHFKGINYNYNCNSLFKYQCKVTKVILREKEERGMILIKGTLYALVARVI